MIIQPTTEQTRKVSRSRAYSGSGHGFGPRAFECIGIGMGLGLGLSSPSATAPVPVNWGTFFPSTLWAIQSDRGITASTTFTAADQSGNGKDFTAVTTGRPTMGTGPNGFPEITFDGVANKITCAALNIAAPGTTPSWIFACFRLISYTSGNPVLWGAAVTGSHYLYILPSPNDRLSSFAGTDLHVDTGYPTMGSYECTELFRNNKTTDYLRRGPLSATATGVNTGNNGPTSGFSIGGANALQFANFGLLCMVGCSAKPTAPQIAAARASVTGMYGGSVQV